jgi:hypothetical protein
MSHENGGVRSAGLKAAGAYLEECTKQRDTKPLQPLLPQMITVVTTALGEDEERARL